VQILNDLKKSLV